MGRDSLCKGVGQQQHEAMRTPMGLINKLSDMTKVGAHAKAHCKDK